MTLLDITRPLEGSLAGWPGDTPLEYGLRWSRDTVASVNAGWVRFALHTGTHADAPYHFDDAGVRAEHLDPSVFLGPAVVVDARGRDFIHSDLLPDGDLPARVLFRTDAWTDPTRFPDEIPVLAPELPELLGRRGVRLAGFDVPSVDRLGSVTLPIHHALAAAGITILEGLDLSRVSPGRYDLIALPLLLPGADAAPVRALLRVNGGG